MTPRAVPITVRVVRRITLAAILALLAVGVSNLLTTTPGAVP